jgi:hypothetical protein
MRSTSVLVIIFLICSCGNTRQTTDSPDLVLPDSVASLPSDTAVQVNRRYDPLIQAFNKAVIDKDRSLIRKFYPSIHAAKRLAKDAVKGKTDEQIQKEMLDPMKSRFEQNLKSIDLEMIAHKVQVDLFSYTGVRESDETRTLIPQPVEVLYDNDGKEVSIPITIAYIDGSWYVFEILKTSGLFD